jgi:hypothetical protein
VVQQKVRRATEAARLTRGGIDLGAEGFGSIPQ